MNAVEEMGKLIEKSLVDPPSQEAIDWAEEVASAEENRLQQQKQKMIDILRSHGIEMNVGGCGCCGSPWVSFRYKGELIVDGEEECQFYMINR